MVGFGVSEEFDYTESSFTECVFLAVLVDHDRTTFFVFIFVNGCGTLNSAISFSWVTANCSITSKTHARIVFWYDTCWSYRTIWELHCRFSNKYSCFLGCCLLSQLQRIDNLIVFVYLCFRCLKLHFKITLKLWGIAGVWHFSKIDLGWYQFILYFKATIRITRDGLFTHWFDWIEY